MLRSFNTTRRLATTLFASMLALPTAAPRANAALVNYDITAWTPAVPQASTAANSPLRYLLNVPDTNTPGKISSIPIDVQVERWPMVRPVGQPVETPAEAQVRKANAIRDAINAEFMRLTLNQRAQVAVNQTRVIAGYVPQVIAGRIVQVPVFANVPVPNISIKGLAYDTAEADRNKRRPAITLVDPTKQPAGNVGGRPGEGVQPNPTPSPGSMRGLGSSSSGLNSNGGPSEVTFGFYSDDGTHHVATINPTPGLTDTQVLTKLADLLINTWGASATLDSPTNTLTLHNVLQSSDTFAFGNTDTGLSFEFGYPAAVPDPATLKLLAVGSLLLLRRPTAKAGARRAA